MGIKRYVLLSIIYLLAVGLYVYSFNGSDYALNIYTFSLNLPIAIWIVIPAIILFLSSLSHLTYYSIKAFFYKRALKKDFETFIKYIGAVAKYVTAVSFIMYFYLQLINMSVGIIKIATMFKDDGNVIDAISSFIKKNFNIVKNYMSK